LADWPHFWTPGWKAGLNPQGKLKVIQAT